MAIYIVGTSQFLRAKILLITIDERLCVSHPSRKDRTHVSRDQNKLMCQERRIEPITARAGRITISYKQALIGGKQ